MLFDIMHKVEHVRRSIVGFIHDLSNLFRAARLMKSLTIDQRELMNELIRTVRSKRARNTIRTSFMRDVEYMAISMDLEVRELNKRCHAAGIPDILIRSACYY